MPVLHLTRGLRTGLVKSSPEHCVDALNVFDRQGDLVKRGGMEPYFDPAVTVSTGGNFGFGASDGTATLSGTTATGDSNDIYAYLGLSGTFNHASVYGKLTAAATTRDTLLEQLTVKYWNGTAWTACNARINLVPYYDSANDSFSPAPWLQYGSAGAVTASRLLFHITIDPPSDWALTSINSQNKYYLRIEGFAAGDLDGAEANSSTLYATGVEPIIHINTWQDRSGARHELVIRRSDASATFSAWLDGNAVTISDDIAFSSGPVLDASTRVDSFYHPVTNRVIGRITGRGWFFLSIGPRRMDLFSPDDTPGRPYQSLPEGLRSAMPRGDVVAMFDGRLFAFDKGHVTWSAPDAFPDVWPNQFEYFIQEGEGPVTAAVAFKSFMAVFTTTAVFRVTPTGGDGYLFEKISSSVGCLGPRAACSVGDVAAFMSGDGVYTFDGSTVSCISRAIEELFHTDAVTPRPADAWLLFNQQYNQLRVFYRGYNSDLEYDGALYANLDGYITRVDGEPAKELAWWPQGKYEDTDYGFSATYLHMDLTRANPVMLIGDRYGPVWQADSGDYDGGSAVQAFARGMPVNVDTSQQVIVTRVDVSLRNTGDKTLSIEVVPDEREDQVESYEDDTYVGTDTALVDSTTVVDSTSTVQDADAVLLMECPFALLCRSFSVGFKHEAAGQVQIMGFDVKVSRAGNRGERGR